MFALKSLYLHNLKLSKLLITIYNDYKMAYKSIYKYIKKDSYI